MNEYDDKRLDIAVKESEKYCTVRVMERMENFYYLSARNEALYLDFEYEEFSIKNLSKENNKIKCDNFIEALYKFINKLKQKINK